MDLVVHKNSIDIDHVVPLKVGGKDDPDQFCPYPCELQPLEAGIEPRSRAYPVPVLALEKNLEEENRSPKSRRVLAEAGGGNQKLGFKLNGDTLTYSLAELGDNNLSTVRSMRMG